MKRPTLHVLGLPHTVTAPEWSHCAFTGKILRFVPMMSARGYDVLHYGVEGAALPAEQCVVVSSRAHLEKHVGKHDPASPVQYGAHARVDSPLYKGFNARLRDLLDATVRTGDVICLPFGHGHAEAISPRMSARAAARDVFLLETGIGYPEAWCEFRVYESAAWMHYHLGKEQRAQGSDYWWVIPNYYDLVDWPVSYARGRYVLFFGRLNEDKGLRVVMEIARARPDLPVVICGQGDPAPWLAYGLPNVEYRPPIWGEARAELYRGALVTVCPSRYVEPFGGVAVESMLCGTPVLASPFGAYTETIQQGVSGWRCHTLGDYLAAIELAENQWLWRGCVHGCAKARYDMREIGARYEEVIEQLTDLRGAGWFSPRSPLRPSTERSGA